MSRDPNQQPLDRLDQWEDFIEDMVPVIGSERIIFGSNAPEYTQSLEVLRPRLAHLEEQVKAQMLYTNGAKLLGIC